MLSTWIHDLLRVTGYPAVRGCYSLSLAQAPPDRNIGNQKARAHSTSRHPESLSYLAFKATCLRLCLLYHNTLTLICWGFHLLSCYRIPTQCQHHSCSTGLQILPLTYLPATRAHRSFNPIPRYPSSAWCISVHLDHLRQMPS